MLTAARYFLRKVEVFVSNRKAHCMVLKKLIIIERICVEQISRSLNLELSRSLVRQIFLAWSRKCESFHLNNYSIGLAANSQYLLQTILHTFLEVITRRICLIIKSSKLTIISFVLTAFKFNFAVIQGGEILHCYNNYN